MKERNYYLAVNQYGYNRAFEPYNGWIVIAYSTIRERNREFQKFDFIKTGVEIITRKEIDKIMGTKKWYKDENDFITACPF